MSQIQGSSERGVIVISIRTLGFEELKLAVQELKVRLGEDNFRNVFLAGTRASTDVARFSHGITVVNDLHLGGVDVLCRHCVNGCREAKRQVDKEAQDMKELNI
jgi:hypothetical protein